MTPGIRKQLAVTWARKIAKIANLVQIMETELDRLRAKKISADFIAEKSGRIDIMLDAINTADEIITAYKTELIQLRIENNLLHAKLTEEQTLELINQPSTSLLKVLHENQKKSPESR